MPFEIPECRGSGEFEFRGGYGVREQPIATDDHRRRRSGDIHRPRDARFDDRERAETATGGPPRVHQPGGGRAAILAPCRVRHVRDPTARRETCPRVGPVDVVRRTAHERVRRWRHIVAGGDTAERRHRRERIGSIRRDAPRSGRRGGEPTGERAECRRSDTEPERTSVQKGGVAPDGLSSDTLGRRRGSQREHRRGVPPNVESAGVAIFGFDTVAFHVRHHRGGVFRDGDIVLRSGQSVQRDVQYCGGEHPARGFEGVFEGGR
mmetsp:Transcript_34198/g.82683  ORF Transcript_34198/g.82683 Transcript_34198/m.82683 type:complete len:264 (-) Transcript_34198:708-1499(-)